MRPRKNVPLNRGRVSLMALLMLAFCAGIVGLVRELPDSAAGNLAAAAAALPLSFVAASLLEWVIHRYIYHGRALPFMARIYRIHHHGHHHVFFPTWRYVTTGAPRRHPVVGPDPQRLYPAGWRSLPTKLTHAAFYIAVGASCVWLPAWLLTGRIAFLASIVVCNLVIADMLVRVHDAIHYPERHRWLQRMGWFRFLDRHHYIHHVDTRANVNFMLPLADWLFGTLRRTLTEDELRAHGSPEEARARPVGASEPAREVARPHRQGAGVTPSATAASAGR
jgi:hypothetical protein